MSVARPTSWVNGGRAQHHLVGGHVHVVGMVGAPGVVVAAWQSECLRKAPVDSACKSNAKRGEIVVLVIPAPARALSRNHYQSMNVPLVSKDLLKRMCNR